MLCLVMVCMASISDVGAQQQFDPLDPHDPHFIIGGQEIGERDYPWVVALAANDNRSLFQRQFCGASVIADKWLMTAAHCLFNARGQQISSNEVRVAIGNIDLNAPNVEELLVTNIIVHPAYEHQADNPHSDIALIELATSSGIEPIKVSTTATDRLFGLQATVIGWGAVDFSDPDQPIFPSRSREVDVPVVSLDVCNAPISYANGIFVNQLCAGLAAGGRDSCVGDSGGPLVVTFEGELQQIGVVSFGFGCALPNFYGIYTNVPHFIDWINQYVFVGEPEFEPPIIDVRVGSATALGNEPSTGSGATSLFGVLLLCTGLLFRRRS